MSSEEETQQKLAIAKQKKDVGDQAFKAGEVVNALRAYHESLLYLEGINKNAAAAMPAGPMDQASNEPKPKTEADEMLEKIYSNMSACHIKKGSWKRAVETADKALKKNDKNTKALFRKAKALGEQGYFEKAEKILEDLLKTDGTDKPSIEAELARLRALDKEREKKHNKKFKGFLNRESKGKGVENDEEDIIEISSPATQA
ncbi:TPR-like protein [Phanerochaete sordida]|uniref:TPR-like protein n=1 Tax=Phanerochaete sordida TaxID=48140 RepID=A0A9P3LC27_9APHY|nr:TPR-like protein [Phanerochaete sordida]